MTGVFRSWLTVWGMILGPVGLLDLGTPAASGAEVSPPVEQTAIRWVGADGSNSGPPVAVEWVGWTAEDLGRLQKAVESGAISLPELFTVSAVQLDLTQEFGLPPMLGAHRIGSDRIRFEPQFPFASGVGYRAVARPAKLRGIGGARSSAPPLTSRILLPKRRATPSTRVTAVYPSSAIVPENLLKFYVQFSAPMSRGHIYDHIRLADASGRPVELPFLEIDEELWDPENRRLTLFIDPGRIKRGVKPLEEVGPSLQEGERYTLTIQSAWRDEDGLPLIEPFSKHFQVGKPDRRPIAPDRWSLTPPRAGSREPLRVEFDRPMDHALASRVIRVVRGDGVVVPGVARLVSEERVWEFLPEAVWSSESCAVEVESTLEDLAGNNIGKAFEVDLFEPVQRRIERKTARIPFRPVTL